jgi:hypothetical protein
MTTAIGFGARDGGHPTTDGIGRQIRAYDAMARQVGEHALPRPEEGIGREDCLRLCLSIDAVKVAEKVAVDLSTGVVTGLTKDIVLSKAICEEFRADPSKFDEWAWNRKAEKEVGADAFIIALNTITVGSSRFSIPTECLTWIVAQNGKATKEILRLFKFVAGVTIGMGARVVLFTSDGDSTFLGELQTLFGALTGADGHECLLDGSLPLHAQHAVAVRVGWGAVGDRPAQLEQGRAIR